MATFWSVAVEDASPARAAVTLHWVAFQEDAVLESVLDASASLGAFLDSASETLAGGPLGSLLVAFKRAAPESLGPPETEAMASTRKDANGPGEKGEKGVSKGGGYGRGSSGGKGNRPYPDSQGQFKGSSGKGKEGGTGKGKEGSNGKGRGKWR